MSIDIGVRGSPERDISSLHEKRRGDPKQRTLLLLYDSGSILWRSGSGDSDKVCQNAPSRISSWSVSVSILWGSGFWDSDRVCQNAPKPYLE